MIFIELCFQSILMSPNLTHPSDLNVFVRNLNQESLNEEKIDETINLLGGSASKTLFNDETERYLIELTSNNVGIKFWIGFRDVRTTELYRHDYTSLTTK